MTDRPARPATDREEIAKALFDHWKANAPVWHFAEYEKFYQDYWLGFADAIPALSKAPAPTGIESAKLVADYLRLRFTDEARDGDDGDAANIIHILHEAGVAFGRPEVPTPHDILRENADRAHDKLYGVETAQPSSGIGNVDTVDLVERLRHPLWVHSNAPFGSPQLDKESTELDLVQAAEVICQYRSDQQRDEKLINELRARCGVQTEPVAWRWHAHGEVRWSFGAYPPNDETFTKQPLFVALSPDPAKGREIEPNVWVKDLLDLYFAPWGVAKAARFEAMTGDKPFDAEVVLKLIHDKLKASSASSADRGRE